MHLDTRRCIAGQTTADGEEKEGMRRRMGGWGDGGAQDREDFEAPSVPQSAVEAPTKRTPRGTQGKRGGCFC